MARTSVLHRIPASAYPTAVQSQGMYIQDSSGRKYLDMSGGAAVSCVGHGHPGVVAAVKAQLSRLAFAHTAFFTNEPQEELARRLIARFGDPAARAYFTSGGSEANETALKMAWQYWNARAQPDKKIVISREHSYHGNTLGVLSVSGNSARRKASAAPLLDWPRISPCYAFRDRAESESLADYVERVSAELEDAITTTGADRVAAFICEPVVGSSLGVVPDIATLGKGIGGGYQPLAATVVSGKIAQTLHRSGFIHGHTYIGHATACAAGVAVQDVLDEEGLLARTQQMGRQFGDLLQDRFGSHPLVGDIRGRGMFWALELVSDRETGRGFRDQPNLPQQLLLAAMEAGLICYPGGIFIDGSVVPHVMLAPPMVLEEQHMLQCVDLLGQTLKNVFDV